MKRVNLAAIANQLQDLAIQVPILCCRKRCKIVLIYLRLSLVIIYLFIYFFKWTVTALLRCEMTPVSKTRKRRRSKWGHINVVAFFERPVHHLEKKKKKTNWFIMKYQGGSLHLSQICCRVICFLSGKRPIETRRQETPAISHRRGPFQNPMVIFANNGQTERCIIGWMFCVNTSLSNALNLTVNGFNHVQLEHARDDGSFEIIVKFENVVYFDRRQPVGQYLLDSSSTLKYWLKLLLWLKR